MVSTAGLVESRRAAVAILALGIYLEAVEWLDLEPWTTSFNVTHGSNGQETLDYVIAGVVVVLVAALWRGWRLAAPLATATMGFWGWLQVSTWWIPYFAGAPPGWKKVYAKWFANTVQFLPSPTDHLPPDANHFVLQILILLAFALCLWAAFSAFSERRSG